MPVNVSESSSLTVNGITPVAGPGLTLLASPSLTATNVLYDDYLAQTFTINPETTTTALSMDDIVTGKVLWVQTDAPIDVTLVQTTDRTVAVDSFLHIHGTFTGVKFANSSLDTAAHVSIIIVGARATNSGAPGIF